MIQRENFISGLFSSKSILNEFNEVEFESFTLFLEAFEKQIFMLKKNQILLIPIKEIKEFDIFVDIVTTSYLTDKCNIVINVEPDLLIDVLERCKDLKHKKFGIMTSSDIKYGRDDFKDIDGYNIWTENNPLYIKININYNNIEEMVSRFAHIYIKQGWRYFKLMFDYESFDEATLEDVHKIEFWLFEIINWTAASHTERASAIRDNQQPIKLYHKGFKTMFLSNDYKLYLNRQAFEEGEMLFDLGKHIEHNGEQVPYTELNKLRSYIDLKPEFYDFKKINHGYIDFYQNLKIMGSINEVPIITKIVGDILYV